MKMLLLRVEVEKSHGPARIESDDVRGATASAKIGIQSCRLNHKLEKSIPEPAGTTRCIYLEAFGV